MQLKGFQVLRWPGMIAVLLLVVFGLLGIASAEQGAPDNADVIVIFREGTDVWQRDRILRQAGAAPRRYFQVVNAAAARLPNAVVRALLEQDPDVQAVVPDRPVFAHAKPPDKGNNKKGGGGGSGEVIPAGVQRIGAVDAWGMFAGYGVGVAVVDTGLDFGHPDLLVDSNNCFTAFTSCQDDNGHGTHVGGIIAALNNGIDVVGVAPGAKLYAVKVLNGSGSGTDSTVMAGLDWIALNWESVTPHIRVVNMSLGRLGTLGDNPVLRTAVQVLHGMGIAVVVSAGNDPYSEVSLQVPATYPEVMAIASTTAVDGVNKRCRRYSGTVRADSASYFTTDGIGVTVSAPGEKFEDVSRSCLLKPEGILSTALGGGTTRMYGTSMAAPHVAGVVAIMMEDAGGNLDPEEARGIIRSTAYENETAPLDSPSGAYTFDGEREGIVSAAKALGLE